MIEAELEGVAPTGVFICSGASYLVPDAGFRFTERRRLDLARG